jgi:hypothetical protein
MKLLAALIIVSLLNGATAAQQRPNFSGQWVLSSSSTANAATELTLELCFSEWFCGNGAYRLPRYLPASRPAQPREYLSVERRFRDQGMGTVETTVVSASALNRFGGEPVICSRRLRIRR